jgi:putative addiction module antidote
LNQEQAIEFIADDEFVEVHAHHAALTQESSAIQASVPCLLFVHVITMVITWKAEQTMLKLKVRKFGNSLGVVLPKEVILRLQTKNGSPLFLIEAPDGSYRLTPFDPAFARKMAKAEDIISRYRNTLHVLAE